MKDIRRKIEEKQRELDELIVEILVKSKLNDHHPNFPIKEKLDKAAVWVASANNKLFYAIMSLGGGH